MVNVLEHLSVLHGYMGQLLDYIILEMPLATFDTGIAEIFAINFSDGIIIVPPSSQTKHLGLNLYPGTFFLFGHNFIEEPEELGNVTCVFCPNFHTGQAQYFFHCRMECP